MSGLESGGLLPNLVVRGSAGLSLRAPTDYAQNQAFKPDESKTVKTFQFSHDGTKLAWSNLSTVQISVFKNGGWTVSLSLNQPKTSAIAWSPCSTHLATWEMYAIVNGQDPKPNLNIWNIDTGERVRSLFQKKYQGWCPTWNKDESLCSRMVNNEIQFYGGNDFSKLVNKLHLNKVTEFAMSPNSRAGPRDQTHVVAYAPGAKGGPSFCKLYQYPNFEDNQVLAHKSFFQADSVDMKWNSCGTCCLLLIQADVDKTGSSYYGRQQLHGINTRGDAFMVSLSKQGPIYDASWNPAGKQFTVVYGTMPAKASLFNEKGDQVFDFGIGHKNMAMYNQQGNILMIAGFGNLRGKIDMWNVSGGKPDHVSSFEAPDQTDVKWNPDGKHIVTSTCAPRLRTDNGYKIWHYSGSLMHEHKIQAPEELWEVDWETKPLGMFPAFPVSKAKVEGIQVINQPVKQAYRPPHARSGGPVKTFNLHEYQSDNPPQIKPTNEKKDEDLSKSALKNKRRRENAKKRKDDEDVGGGAEVQNGGGSQAGQRSAGNRGSDYQGAAGLLFDPEVEKKKKKINDKLNSIKSLKQQQAEGKTLEKNQLDKIAKENELLEELKKLSVRQK